MRGWWSRRGKGITSPVSSIGPADSRSRVLGFFSQVNFPLLGILALHVTRENELTLQASLLGLSGNGSEGLRIFHTFNLAWECPDPSPGRESFVFDQTHYGSWDLFSWSVSKKGLGQFWGPWGFNPPLLVFPPSPWAWTGKRAPERCCLTFPGTPSLTWPLAWPPMLEDQQQF